MEFPDSDLVIAQRCKKVCCFWIVTIIVVLVGLMAAIVTLQVVYYAKDEQQHTKVNQWAVSNVTNQYNFTGYEFEVTTEQTSQNNDEVTIGTTQSTPTSTENDQTITSWMIPIGALPPPQNMGSGNPDAYPSFPGGRSERGPGGGRDRSMIPLGQPREVETITTKKPFSTTLTTSTTSTTSSTTQRVLDSTTNEAGSDPTVVTDTSPTEPVETGSKGNVESEIDVKIALMKLEQKQRIQDILVSLILTLFGIGAICTICTVMIVKGVFKKERCRLCIFCFKCVYTQSPNPNDSAVSDSSQQLDSDDSSQEVSADSESQNTSDGHNRSNSSHHRAMETSFTVHFHGLPSYSEAISTPQLASELSSVPVPPVTANDGTLYTQVPHLHRSTSSLPSYEEACKTSDSHPKPLSYTHSLPSPRLRTSPVYVWPEQIEQSQQPEQLQSELDNEFQSGNLQTSQRDSQSSQSDLETTAENNISHSSSSSDIMPDDDSLHSVTEISGSHQDMNESE